MSRHRRETGWLGVPLHSAMTSQPDSRPDRPARRARWTSRVAFVVGVLTGVAALALLRHADPLAVDLGALYDASARRHGPDRNPVVVIHGLGGSRLVDGPTGAAVWGTFGDGYADPDTPAGARLTALPMREGARLRDLRDGVVSEESIREFEVRLAGFPVRHRIYADILRALGVGGYRPEGGDVDYGDDHATCFEFHYDWRRDNVENARRLHAFLLEKRAFVRARYEARYGRADADVRFDLVAHSMGGLLTRYYLRYGPADLPADRDSLPPVTWAGAALVERAVLVSPPNAGSAGSLLQLVEGRGHGPFLPEYPPALLGTFPSGYQLIPRGRHGALVVDGRPADPLDPALWERMGWGLLAPDQDHVLQRLLPAARTRAARRRIARDHLRKSLARARQFQQALDVPARPPDGLSLYLFAGGARATPAVLAADAGGPLRVVDQGPGDGTVLRSSALLDERVGGPWAPRVESPVRWRQAFFLPSGHTAITSDPTFTDNLLHVLLEAPE